MMIITGDIHGFEDTDGASRFSRKNKEWYPLLQSLTKEDYVIICGDFGLLWDNSNSELYWREWLNHKPFTTLFIDGNHENFDMLYEYPTEDWNGGKIRKISDSIFHLARGQVFEIEGRKIFTMGGAESHDKHRRTEGVSWWSQEMPTESDFEEARTNLERYDWNVDIVLTHSLPSSLQATLYEDREIYPANPLTDFLDEVYSKITFEKWYTGHYHLDGYLKADQKIRIIYRMLREL